VITVTVSDRICASPCGWSRQVGPAFLGRGQGDAQKSHRVPDSSLTSRLVTQIAKAPHSGWGSAGLSAQSGERTNLDTLRRECSRGCTKPHASPNFRDPDHAWARAFSREVGTGSHRNQVHADCVDLSAVENASKQKIEPVPISSDRKRL